MKVASLDLGSNTFLLLIAEGREGHISRVLHDEARVTRLSQQLVESKRLHPDSLKRANDCLDDYMKIIRNHGCDKIQAVATSAARDAENAEEFLQITRELGIPVEIVDGQREAELTYLGASEENVEKVIIDVGGGSTELIGLNAQKKPKGFSLQVGSVRYAEMFHGFDKLSKEALSNIKGKIIEQLESASPLLNHLQHQPVAIAVAGTPTQLACLDLKVDFDPSVIDGHVMSLSRGWEWVNQLAGLTVSQRKALKGMDPARADVILMGSLILFTCLEFLGFLEVTVSIRGVRYGLAKTML